MEVFKQIKQANLKKRAESVVDIFYKHIYGKILLDIGTGGGQVAKVLKDREIDVTALDIEDKTAVKSVEPIVYDGHSIPFESGSFDTSLLCYVLHHTKSPEKVLGEAIRVSRDTVIVVEDVYVTKLQEKVFKVIDSIVNMEFSGHPHNNRTNKEWGDTFKKLGVDLVHSERLHLHWLGIPFPTELYVLKTKRH